MPGIVKVKVIECQDLPVMDRASELTDAFVELRIGNVVYKTDVCRKSLNPQWDSEWFKFEVDDEELQEEYLQVKVLDYDVYSSHDAIGKVNISLNLLVRQDGSNGLHGLFPIYDTLHGIRGYIRLKVRIQLFSDANKYRQTSCGIQFFSAHSVPSGYIIASIQGFVDELIVNNDPEYQWIDKIRTPRASNEARIRLFTNLSGEMKRKIGLKVLEAGGNAVIGYEQHIDLEGEMGVVIRAIGTSVTLVHEQNDTPRRLTYQRSFDPESRSKEISHVDSRSRQLSVSSDNEVLVEGSEMKTILQKTKSSIDEMVFPFYTIKKTPPGFIQRIGGMVSSLSVKLLNKVNSEEVDTRDSWWKELRTEIRSNAKTFGCNAVIGYSEYSTICDDLAVLTAYGTAATLQLSDDRHEGDFYCSLEPLEEENLHNVQSVDGILIFNEKLLQARKIQRQNEFDSSSVISSSQPSLPSCNICHVPYNDADFILPVTLSRCLLCKQDKVPDVILSTIELPEDLPIIGSGCMIQARVIRCKKKDKEESNAENVGQILPFIEFDLHQQMINKLKLKGMNAIFGLTTCLTMAEQTIIGVMTGTAVYISALPLPKMFSFTDTKINEKSFDTKKKSTESKQHHSFKELNTNSDQSVNSSLKTGKSAITSDGKELSFMELDDLNDMDLLPLFSDPLPQEGFNIFSTQATPGQSLFDDHKQLLTVFKRVKIPLQDDSFKLSQWLASVFDNLIMGVCLKVRSFIPCSLINTSFYLGIDDDEYFHIMLTTFVVGNVEMENKPKAVETKQSPESGHIWTEETLVCDDLIKEAGMCESSSRMKKSFQPHVTVCTLDYIPNMSVTSYLGNVNIFLIRESTCVKEEGGLGLFMQQFMNEIHTIVRAYVVSLNGNAIMSFNVNEIMLSFNPPKNQAQILVNVTGDAACVKEIDPTEILHMNSYSPSSDISSSPTTPSAPEIIEEIKYKLDRAVYGTNV
nr:C2 domain-containing protein 5 isoform X3 [Hydra vulgaris]